ncbi:hypothetical protein [Paenibacillus nasutitermitis]|uniref:Uncharacterized protein n=1 Tax=Paenibacillus nasutitermitis TaxID=1652958 RepID=A0A917E073_9BACL|nr:hypothetical protein [Paenibacillus nasutitermitis]GGD86692.1 hypothetical protein GCM10010911_51460 [Paenibacillus nasutitermitis]
MDFKKYVGRYAQIIYQDAKNQISQRRVFVYSLDGAHVRIFCLKAGAYRILKREQILAIVPEPARRHAI